MQVKLAPVRAAIDIGSNTIHIVVARYTPDTLDIVEDQVDLTRIGESVTATGAISPGKCAEAIATLEKYKTLAEQHGSEAIFVVATEAIRQASNSADFLAQVKCATGLNVQLISGSAEAALTFYGTTYGSDVPPQAGVMDLGGGSMELVAARNTHIAWRTSVPLGSGWLHDRYLHSNPPTYDEVAVADAFLETYFAGMHIKRVPAMLIVTGGSANSLLHLAHRALRLELHSQTLTLKDLIRCQGLLSAFPAEDIARFYELPLGRAKILLAGALIIHHVMIRLHLEEIRVSPHGIREGVLLAYARYGSKWLDAVSRDDQKKALKQALPPQEEAFIQAGRQMLVERTKRMLEWRAEVLKHEDVEAVHKMRVASRRLRAALDAFESCCDPPTFKKVYRKVKAAADILGAARDADVMLLHLQEQIAQMPGEGQAGVRWLMERLKGFRQQKQDELETFLHTLDERKLGRQIEACISAGKGEGAHRE